MSLTLILAVLSLRKVSKTIILHQRSLLLISIEDPLLLKLLSNSLLKHFLFRNMNDQPLRNQMRSMKRVMNLTLSKYPQSLIRSKDSPVVQVPASLKKTWIKCLLLLTWCEAIYSIIWSPKMLCLIKEQKITKHQTKIFDPR